MSPKVFLFSIESLQATGTGPYNGPALAATFGSILDSDSARVGAFQLRQGDLLLHTLCYAPTRVEFDGERIGRSRGGVRTANVGDIDLFKTLIWDLQDALAESWNTVDPEAFLTSIGSRDVFALAVSDLSDEFSQATDAALRRQPFYLGGFEADPGNPIQRHILVDSLAHSFDYRHRVLLFDPWQSEGPLDPLPLDRLGEEWYSSLPFDDVRYLTAEEGADNNFVPGWPHPPISKRGARSAAILAERTDGGHLARVAEEAARLPIDDDLVPYVIDMKAMPGAADATIDEAKLVGYLLNPDHDRGRDKARWFWAVLGIEAADWRHLSAQLRQGLLDARMVERLRSTEFGIQYNVETAVTGINGATAFVVSAWEVAGGGPPRLITAYPGAHADGDVVGPPALTIPSSLTDSERWSALWKLAESYADEAASRTVPTPMRIGDAVGAEWVSEGLFGFARVEVPDARRSFPRWLVREGKATVDPGRGAGFLAPTTSLDRGRAWADAFVEVLAFNGIEASASSELD